jgi:beta-fructofuranosidase
MQEQQNNSLLSEKSLRDKLMRDPLWPQFHLLPAANWMNDPNGPMYWDGEYHLFYQYNPDGACCAQMHWGHAISPDLIHWKHMPIALSPTENSYDSYGCFTGSALPGTEVASVIYTGVSKVPRAQETIRAEGLREVQCIATSTDADLRTWRKLDQPVIEAPPQGVKVVGFRDPFSWKDGDTWYVGVGSGFPQVGGAVLLYRSSDARHWEYVHPLAQGSWNGKSFTNPVGSGEMWECPDFFPLGDKHILLYNTQGANYWEVGTYDNRELRFHSERKGFLDHGVCFAATSMMDGQNRRIIWGCILETRPHEVTLAAGWAGAMSLPRQLTLSPDNELRMEVPPEFASLRTNTVVVNAPRDSKELEYAQSRAVIHNRAGEIVCTFKAAKLDCGLELLIGSSLDRTTLFKVQNGVSIGETPSIIVGDRTLALSPDQSGYSILHLWIDGSIIELFADAKQVITMRCYATAEEPSDIHVRWTGRADSLISLMVSDITPISNDRLTT